MIILDKSVLLLAKANARATDTSRDLIQDFPFIDLDDLSSTFSLLLLFVVVQTGPLRRYSPGCAVFAENGGVCADLGLGVGLLFLVPTMFDLVHKAFPARCHIFVFTLFIILP